MTIISVSIPEDLKNKMDNLDEVNWSAVARKAFEEKVNDTELFKKLISKSKFSEKDAKDISTRINKQIANKFREM